MLPLSSMPPISLLPPFMVCGDGDRCVRLMSLDFLILDVTPLKEEAVMKKKYGEANRVSFVRPTESNIYRNSLLEQLLMESKVLCRLDQWNAYGN
ncbi:hypothetical protein Tco_0992520 [Tanacetum coccineum]|uniref:Uncharacterized protein n=1 Tax=Tanacetum coccineum TaxID=301880 RepID=A0ABQ5F2B5_9ASTR